MEHDVYLLLKRVVAKVGERPWREPCSNVPMFASIRLLLVCDGVTLMMQRRMRSTIATTSPQNHVQSVRPGTSVRHVAVHAAPCQTDGDREPT